MDRTKGLSLIALAAALAAPAMAQAKPVEGTLARQMQFDIGASDLRSAISRFSRATGVQVIVAPDVVAKRRTAGVRGAHSVREALDLMLRGTNLSASISDGVAVLKPVAAAPAGDDTASGFTDARLDDSLRAQIVEAAELYSVTEIEQYCAQLEQAG